MLTAFQGWRGWSSPGRSASSGCAITACGRGLSCSSLPANAGVPLFRPDSPEAYGGFSLLPHPEAAEIAEALREARVNVDSRSGFVRFGADLLTTAAELERAMTVTREVLADYART